MEKKLLIQIIKYAQEICISAWELNLTGYAISRPRNVDEYLATTGVVIE